MVQSGEAEVNHRSRSDAGRPHEYGKSPRRRKILQSITDGVGVITFNNPEKRNAMSLDMWQGLGLALVECAMIPGCGS